MKFADLIDGRENNLNLIRLMAASAVALSHSYNFTNQLPSEPLFKWTGTLSFGYLSVFIFFVISGFLVAQSYERTQSIVGFIAARALRLYPALIVVLLFSAYLIGPFFTTLSLNDYLPSHEVRRYFEDNLLFKQRGVLPGVFRDGGFTAGVNGSLWSLRYEAYAYLLLLLCGVGGLISKRPVFNAFVALSLLLYAKDPLGTFLIPGDWSAVIYVPIIGFVVGMLIYINRGEIDCKISYAIIAFILYIWLKNHQWVHLIFAVTIGYVTLTLGFHQWLQLHISLPNDYSYGIYLYAFPVQQVITRTVSVQSPMLLFVLTMLLTVPLAMISWHAVEKPALRLKRFFVPIPRR